MLYPSIDELKKRADSRYTLVMMASKRSRDLIDGYPPLVDIGISKPVSIATEEIARDMISYTRDLRPETEEVPEDEITMAPAEEEGMESSETGADAESAETEEDATEEVETEKAETPEAESVEEETPESADNE